jgi:4-amino-4-deoxy-L-arabinose transferase-like glycosyltransferase
MLSDRILEGNFDLDIVAFIVAPLYPYFIALCKLIASENWELLAVSIQFLLVSLSSVYIYKTAYLIFKSTEVAIISAVIFIIYPMTLWYNFTLTQETLFQSFFIIFCFNFLELIKTRTVKNTILASIFFALAFLTKSHITVLFPIILGILLVKIGFRKTVLFALIILIFTIPHGLVNKKLHGVYSFSSYGSNALLVAGHSSETYSCLNSEFKPFRTSQQKGCDLDLIFHKPYFTEGFGNVNALPIYERNKMRQKIAFSWIKENPIKFIKLKINGLVRFILPGLDFRIYKFSTWILSLLIGLLIYIPAYIILWQALKKDFWQHVLPVSLIISIAIIFLVFYPQQRFRVITLEPILIIYASFFYWKLLKPKFKNLYNTSK